MRRWVRALRFIVFLFILCAGYLYLPETARWKVIDTSPYLDRKLASLGFPITVFVDSLPVWGNEVRIPCSDEQWKHLCSGTPDANRVKILNNPGFTVGYSDSMRNPLWVQYRLFDVKSFKRGKRPDRFKTDNRTSAKVSHDDYTGSGYDRGHMAPNFGIATRYGRKGQLATFYMSNIIPQNPYVNRNVWKEIEMLTAKKYGRFLGEVLVITGPVFGQTPLRLESGVPVPEAYYKIILDHDNAQLRALAFLIRSNSHGTRRLKTALVSIDKIEQLTEIDFCETLSRQDERLLESSPAKHLWFTLPDQLAYYLPSRNRKY